MRVQKSRICDFELKVLKNTNLSTKWLAVFSGVRDKTFKKI